MAHLSVNASGLLHNLRLVAERCRALGPEFQLVFKEAGVRPALLHLMLTSGVCGHMGLCHFPGYSPRPVLAAAGTRSHLLYLVPEEALPEVVDSYDVLYQTSLNSLRAVAREAARQGRRISIVLPVEIGDGRDGVLPGQVQDLAAAMTELAPHVTLTGLAANFACISEIPPSRANIQMLVDLGRSLRSSTGLALPLLSVGGSDVLELAETEGLPSGITEIRCGTAVYLGHYPLSGKPVPGLTQTALRLCGRVVESSRKNGRVRIILDFGGSDTNPELLTPPHTGMILKGVSSGYSVFDITDCPRSFAYGDEVMFGLNHRSLARALASPRIALKVCGHGSA